MTASQPSAWNTCPIWCAQTHGIDPDGFAHSRELTGGVEMMQHVVPAQRSAGQINIYVAGSDEPVRDVQDLISGLVVAQGYAR